jgi:protein gp37
MAIGSKIEWTDATWNPVTGCNKISPGCKLCYAERLSKRLKATGMAKYRNGFEVTRHPEALEIPLRWRKPRTIFVNSMSDLFHEQVPDEFVRDVFSVMAQANWHRFQVLTKRPERIAALNGELAWPTHIWLGVSVESVHYSHRIDLLRECGAAIKFLSLEPLLGPLPSLNLDGIDWVIVGGESGPGARPMEVEWAREIRDQCKEAEVPFYFKQWGGVFKKRRGRILDGKTWDEMPSFDKSPVAM